MSLRSTDTAYGAVAVALHWSIAALIGVAVASGFAADNLGPAGVTPLRVHAASGITAAVLTLVRIGWWRLADVRPAALEGPATLLARAVHLLLQLVPLGLAASGIGMLALSDAGSVLLAGGALPDFGTLAPRGLHGAAAWLMIALVALHMAAALYHQVRLRDAIFRRMGLGIRRA